jgi:hypothetical protein
MAEDRVCHWVVKTLPRGLENNADFLAAVFPTPDKVGTIEKRYLD